MKVWWNCSPRSHFSFIFLCCCSKLCCYCAGSKSGGKYLPMNYASPLQTIIPGSPWKRRTTTATLITSMPVQLWVFFIHYGSRVWLICFLWSPPTPFFSIKSTCCGWILLWEKSSDWSKPIDLFFLLCSPCWEPQWVSCVLLNCLATFTAFKMAAPWRYLSFFFFFFIHTKKNYAFFLTKQRYPIQIQKDLTTGEGYGYMFFLNISPPKHCQSWFPPRLLKRDSIKGKQETMHFKYSAKISEEIDEGGAGCTQLR